MESAGALNSVNSKYSQFGLFYDVHAKSDSCLCRTEKGKLETTLNESLKKQKEMLVKAQVKLLVLNGYPHDLTQKTEFKELI